MHLRKRNPKSAAFTIIEVLTAAAIGTVVLGGLLALVTVVTQQQRKQMVDANLQMEANLLEDKITRLIRAMSATEAVILGDPAPIGVPFYRRMIVARGPSPAVREQLWYDADKKRCVYLPDTKQAETVEAYSQPTSVAVLRNMYFFISEKLDGAPDASAVSVFFQMDDDGAGTRKKTNTLVRTFTATMRNN